MANEYPRFPLFMDISSWNVLVVGGGKISERRVRTLLKFGAKICVICPEEEEGLKELAQGGSIELIKRAFDFKDLKYRPWNMVLAATGNAELNGQIYFMCKEKGIMANNASNHNECDFFFPAIMEGDGIVAGMTSGGEDHAKVKKLAAEIREILSRGDQ